MTLLLDKPVFTLSRCPSNVSSVCVLTLRSASYVVVVLCREVAFIPSAACEQITFECAVISLLLNYVGQLVQAHLPCTV